ncbi:hypothetical protein FRB96_007398 [Tulasnella sp. 330]|nr:hypothetical protein FRB96_007398 [Tulasnella sp. 330]
MAAARKLRLGLFICDLPVPAVVEKYGTYLDIYKAWLENSLNATDRATTIEFRLDGYNFYKGQLPSMEEYDGDDPFDGVIVTGSAASAYEDEKWIRLLVDHLSMIIKQAPHIPIIGICFGHQIVARSMGGRCVRNEKGWEIGTTPVQLTEAGKQVFGADLSTLDIQQMHRDHIPTLPPNMELLASSPIAPVQGMISRHPSGGIHILTVQGHPVSKIIDAREASGVLDAETVKEARIKAAKRDDGVGLIGKACWQVLAPADSVIILVAPQIWSA